MSEQIRVLIADDHPLIRQGLEIVIEEQPDMELVAQAVDGLDAVAKALATRPDVALLDLKMPKQDGLMAMQQIQEALPKTSCIILTSFTDDVQVLEAIEAGAKGFLNKDSNHEDLLGAIRAVSRGDAALHPAAARVLMQSYKASRQPAVAGNALTPMELRVLQLLATGASNRELAATLGVSVRTVTTHVRNILDKLQLKNRTQAALYARENRLTDPHS
ncbi:response regulator transcription factor [Candidatus Chloroploca sp. M-50]|uniref:Response regulator transcription factor n=1 Tax=Candidatus Chloroploca mongolica TaxID=2528176 RepID=A0ABS4DGM0_9CHLR|nr:response regulator transcription factor [Candidatus Chloroploca mongolica]